MARRTFFSFHYKPDVTRAWVVRNSWVTKVAQGERDDAGFFDSSVFEANQRESDEALKRFLREGLNNTTVTCVLVGAQTSLRRWSFPFLPEKSPSLSPMRNAALWSRRGAGAA